MKTDKRPHNIREEKINGYRYTVPGTESTRMP